MELDFQNAIRLLLLLGMGVLFVSTTITFYQTEGLDKLSAGTWLIIIMLNLWLIYMAAATSSIF